MFTLFRDLSAGELQGGIYLVCRIYRKGALIYDTKKKSKKPRKYRRPYGVCAMDLRKLDLMSRVGEQLEKTIQIYCTNNESKFFDLHRNIIAGDKLEVGSRAFSTDQPKKQTKHLQKNDN